MYLALAAVVNRGFRAERAASNAPMQGTAADLIKLSMIDVQNRLDREQLSAKLVMQVHDELVLQVPQTELSRVREELPRLMTGVAQLAVPLVVDVSSGWSGNGRLGEREQCLAAELCFTWQRWPVQAQSSAEQK